MKKKVKAPKEAFPIEKNKLRYQVIISVYDNCQEVNLDVYSDTNPSYYEVMGAVAHMLSAMQFDQIQKVRDKYNLSPAPPTTKGAQG